MNLKLIFIMLEVKNTFNASVEKKLLTLALKIKFYMLYSIVVTISVGDNRKDLLEIVH